MHAVVVHLTITADFDTDTRPTARAGGTCGLPCAGFVAGYWTRKDRSGLSVLVFGSEDAAQAMSESLAAMIPPDAATVDGVEVRKVVAHA